MAQPRRVQCGEEVNAMRLFGLVLAMGLAASLFFNPLFADGQGSKSQPPSRPSAAALLLRNIRVKPHGFDDATLNDTVLGEREEYLKKHLKDGPMVETAYDQKKADEMKKAIEAFWKERGLKVKVRVTLKPLPQAPRYATLEFDEYKQ
jgi:hypothetical protein